VSAVIVNELANSPEEAAMVHKLFALIACTVFLLVSIYDRTRGGSK